MSSYRFHILEFSSTFIFALVECISLTSTPKSILNIYNNPNLLKLILFFNIVVSSFPAVLVILNYEFFEIVSHQVEYMNELTMSFVDLVLLWSLCQFQGTSALMAGIATVVAMVQLAVYNGMGRTEDGDMGGEVPAHYLEFSFEIISSLIAFWFCMDNKVRYTVYIFEMNVCLLLFFTTSLYTCKIFKFVCGNEIGAILYGNHEYCKICSDSSREFTGTYLNSNNKKYQCVWALHIILWITCAGGLL